MSKVISVFKKTPFLAVVTVISFLFFILMYRGELMSAITPHYIRDLVYSIPFVTFGLITFFAAKGKLSRFASYTATAVLIHVFVGLAIFLMLFFYFEDDVYMEINTIDKYERVLKVTNHSLTKCFPKKIPKNAKNITFSFSHSPDLLEAANEEIDLKFQVDSDYIDSYIDKFSKKAKWIGKANDIEANKNCVYSQEFQKFGYRHLPEDFMVYVFYSKPNPNGHKNDYDVSFAAISREKNEMIFFSHDW